MMLCRDCLRQIIDYNPATGQFTWLVNRGRLAKAGQKAGTLRKADRYEYVHIFGKIYGAHILAHYWMTGEWPTEEMDHINGVRSDNRWSNLRHVPRAINGLNRKRYETNTSGIKGVNWHTRLGKWRVRIQKFGKRHALGCYDTLEEAEAAYHKAADEMFGEFKRDDSYGHHRIDGKVRGFER